jgi:hypothetical protein
MAAKLNPLARDDSAAPGARGCRGLAPGCEVQRVERSRMVGGASFGITRSRAALTASVGLVVAAILFAAAYVASNLSDGSLELTRQSAFRFYLFAAIAAVLSIASLWLISALINLVFRSLFAVTVTFAAPAVEPAGGDAAPQANVVDDGFLRQSRDVESAILLAGLVLIFLPLSFVALRSLATEYAQAPKSFSQVVTLPPNGATYVARFTVSDNVDAGESVPASLSIQRVAPAGPSVSRVQSAGKYGARIVASGLLSAPVTAPIFASPLESMRWDWTIASPVAGKDAPSPTGKQAVSTVIVSYSGDGRIIDLIVGPSASINVHEPFTWSGVLAGIAPILSFVLGLGTLIIGFAKRGSDGAGSGTKA